MDVVLRGTTVQVMKPCGQIVQHTMQRRGRSQVVRHS